MVGIDQVRERTFLADFDPSETALVEAKPLAKIGESDFAPDRLDILEAKEDSVRAEVEMEGEGFVVDRDQYPLRILLSIKHDIKHGWVL